MAMIFVIIKKERSLSALNLFNIVAS